MLRDSVLLLGGTCACQALGAATRPRATCCSTPDLEPESFLIGERSITVDLAKAASLDLPGSAARIANKEKNLDILVVRPGKKSYVALAGKCSHAGRPLNYFRSRGVIQCINFGHATFELNGRHIRGPEPRADIKSYAVTRTKGKLEIVL
jgi:nitrite reductase/ring-hydroxylating ferredoxin subunit